jgi:hypothetical protein
MQGDTQWTMTSKSLNASTIAFAPTDVLRLSKGMTYKNAIAGLPHHYKLARL